MKNIRITQLNTLPTTLTNMFCECSSLTYIDDLEKIKKQSIRKQKIKNIINEKY
jgi:hypothetical protein